MALQYSVPEVSVDGYVHVVYNLVGEKGILASACTFNIGDNTIELPKSGYDRTACLTVVCCGQIAGFWEKIAAKMWAA